MSTNGFWTKLMEEYRDISLIRNASLLKSKGREKISQKHLRLTAQTAKHLKYTQYFRKRSILIQSNQN